MSDIENAALARAIYVWGEDATDAELVGSQMDFVAGVEWQREQSQKENERLKKQLAVAVKTLKRIIKKSTDECDIVLAKDALKQIEEMGHD